MLVVGLSVYGWSYYQEVKEQQRTSLPLKVRSSQERISIYETWTGRIEPSGERISSLFIRDSPPELGGIKFEQFQSNKVELHPRSKWEYGVHKTVSETVVGMNTYRLQFEFNAGLIADMAIVNDKDPRSLECYTTTNFSNLRNGSIERSPLVEGCLLDPDETLEPEVRDNNPVSIGFRNPLKTTDNFEMRVKFKIIDSRDRGGLQICLPFGLSVEVEGNISVSETSSIKRTDTILTLKADENYLGKTGRFDSRRHLGAKIVHVPDMKDGTWQNLVIRKIGKTMDVCQASGRSIASLAIPSGIKGAFWIRAFTAKCVVSEVDLFKI